MQDLLIHTSDIKVDILRPNQGVICFSLNQFMPCFGEYVYLFDKKTMENNFYVEERYSGGKTGIFYSNINEPKEFRFTSQPLKAEYVIREPIDVSKYAINVITLFSTMKGVLEERLSEVVMKREIINFETSHRRTHGTT